MPLPKQDWLMNMEMPILPWASKSPDLNSIENLWGDISRLVYANGKQYWSKKDLKDVIFEAWDNIVHDRLIKLSRSMKKLCIDVILNKGKITKY